jgi:hypothetical protein
MNLIRASLFAIALVSFTGLAQAEPTHAGVNVNVNVEVSVNIPVSDGRSAESSKRAKIGFWNMSGEPVKIYWVDFVGNRRLKSTLKPGHSVRLRTYDGHVWVVTDMRDNKLNHSVAEARKETRVAIPKPATPSPTAPAD